MESRRCGVVAARLAPSRAARRRRVRAHPADARRPQDSFERSRTGGPPRVPPASRRRALAPALAFSVVAHAIAIGGLARHPGELASEPVPIPLRWLEIAGDGGPVGPAGGADPGAREPRATTAERREPAAPARSPAGFAPERRPTRAPAPRPSSARAAKRRPLVGPAGTGAEASPVAGASRPVVEADAGGWGRRVVRADSGEPSAALPRVRDRPAPVYPLDARRRGRSGTSAIRLRIAADGRVIEARVHRSAGDLALDAAAVAAVRRWRFEPAANGVDRQQQWFLVPIEFRLE